MDKESTERSDLVSEDGKNIKSVLCQRCGSKVLCPGMAVFAENEVCFPMQKKWTDLKINRMRYWELFRNRQPQCKVFLSVFRLGVCVCVCVTP